MLSLQNEVYVKAELKKIINIMQSSWFSSKKNPPINHACTKMNICAPRTDGALYKFHVTVC